jgi:putative hydrolase of the HAD superfamily
VRHWIFDLDNTLYRSDSGLFRQIESRMTDFVARLTGLDRDRARALQKQLYRDHGTTLNGLMVTRGMDPEPYLDFVHDIDLSPLGPDQGLAEAIGRLPGRRFVFTNGCRNHAARILDQVGLAPLFEEIWDIRHIGFVPKPDPRAYAQVVAAAGLNAGHSAMFDDIAQNLQPARDLGMTTVWLNSGPDFSAGHGAVGPGIVANPAPFHHVTDDLTLFLNSIRI